MPDRLHLHCSEPELELELEAQISLPDFSVDLIPNAFLSRNLQPGMHLHHDPKCFKSQLYTNVQLPLFKDNRMQVQQLRFTWVWIPVGPLKSPGSLHKLIFLCLGQSLGKLEYNGAHRKTTLKTHELVRTKHLEELP